MDAPLGSADESAARFDQRELHDLLRGLSGELCRPLASMRMGFDLLMSDEASALAVSRGGHVDTLRGLCDELLRLTRSYLDYAEVLRASRAPSLGAYSLGALVGEVDRGFATDARRKGLDWSAEAVDDGALVVTDAARWQRIAGALVSNAIKFTPPGGRVQVVGRIEADRFSLAVLDDGPGMSLEEARRVFEPFYRLARDEYAVEGNGLGLSIARELAGQIGGRVELAPRAEGGVAALAAFPRSAAVDRLDRGRDKS